MGVPDADLPNKDDKRRERRAWFGCFGMSIAHQRAFCLRLYASYPVLFKREKREMKSFATCVFALITVVMVGCDESALDQEADAIRETTQQQADEIRDASQTTADAVRESSENASDAVQEAAESNADAIEEGGEMKADQKEETGEIKADALEEVKADE